jgi:hypothetical protein
LGTGEEIGKMNSEISILIASPKVRALAAKEEQSTHSHLVSRYRNEHRCTDKELEGLYPGKARSP